MTRKVDLALLRRYLYGSEGRTEKFARIELPAKALAILRKALGKPQTEEVDLAKLAWSALRATLLAEVKKGDHGIAAKVADPIRDQLVALYACVRRLAQLHPNEPETGAALHHVGAINALITAHARVQVGGQRKLALAYAARLAVDLTSMLGLDRGKHMIRLMALCAEHHGRPFGKDVRTATRALRDAIRRLDLDHDEVALTII